MGYEKTITELVDTCQSRVLKPLVPVGEEICYDLREVALL